MLELHYPMIQFLIKHYIVADNSKHITNSTQREDKYKPKENKERGT